MANGQWAGVVRQVQRLFQGGSISGLSEGQLLDRFATTRDEASFGAILARHGPMVLGICRGVLDDPRDVEDAFQATFLVLVKKAGVLRDGDRLGQWLYGVARRVALRARSNVSRRKSREPALVEPTVDPRSTLDAELRELQVVIREEVDKLSGQYRMAVVLCYLEGLTHEEAADRLGWPIGTVKGRLSRARETLRRRLTRRGVALPAAAIASTLADSASAAVPLELVRSTTLAAIQLASGKGLVAGIVSAQAIALMEGVIGTMISTKLKIVAAALVLTGVVAVPGVLAFQDKGLDGGSKAPTPGLTPNPPVGLRLDSPSSRATPPTPDAAREEEARFSEEALQLVKKTILDGKARVRPPLDRVFTWSRRIAEARTGPNTPPRDRTTALQAHRDRMKEQVDLATELVKSEAYTPFDLLDAKYHLLEAERWLRDGQVGDQPFANPPPNRGAFGGNRFGRVGDEGLPPEFGGERSPANPGAMASSRAGGGFDGGVGGPNILALNQSPADEKRNESIRSMLELPITMNFTSPTPLADIIKYVQQSTQDEAKGFPVGLPLYVDPEGLKTAEVTLESTIRIQLEAIPLRTTLHLMLRQLGLDYRVDGGVVLIADIGQITLQEIQAKRASGLGF